MTDKTLAEIYKKARYILFLGNDTCRLQVGLPAPEIDGFLDKYKTQTAYFITPENPFSQPVGETENKLRHQRFISILDEKSLKYIKGYGTDEQEIWPKEHSYLIFCDDVNAIHTLAANFGQKGMLKLSKNKSVTLLTLEDMHYQEVL